MRKQSGTYFKMAALSAAICVFYAAGPSGSGSAAYAADIDFEALANYDDSMNACMNRLFAADRQTAVRRFDGRGFEWSKERDDFLNECLRESGFEMPGNRYQRTGKINMYDPHPVSAAEKRRRFEEGILKYGGQEVLDRLTSLPAALPGNRSEGAGDPPQDQPSNAAQDRGRPLRVEAPVLPAVPGQPRSETSQAASTPDAPAKPARKRVYITPSDNQKAPKPIWLDRSR